MLVFFFFNDTATTEIYTLSLHDALPIWRESRRVLYPALARAYILVCRQSSSHSSSCRRARSRNRFSPMIWTRDRKSTRLKSRHTVISYAVFCLEKQEMPCALNDRDTSIS